MTPNPRPLPPHQGGDPPCRAHIHGEAAAPARSGLTELLATEILDQLTDAVIVCDHTGTIVYWNRAASALFGWTDEQATGQSLDLIIPERLRSRHWSGWRRAIEAGETAYAGRLLEVPALHRNGEVISIAFTVTLVAAPPDAATISVVAVARDDTERRNQQDALKSELEQLRASAD